MNTNPDTVFSIRVIEVTPELIHEIHRHGLRYHIWMGYPVIEWGWHPELRVRASANTKMEALKYLLSHDYEYAVRALAEERHARNQGNSKSYRGKR